MSSRSPIQSRQGIAAWSAAAIWLTAVVIGSLVLIDHAARPGRVLEPVCSWPGDTTLPRRTDRLTLVMFAHPRCPCTRASISELAAIVRTGQASVDICVVFFCPGDGAGNWRDTELVRQARNIPQARVVFDVDGIEERRFRATVSGQVMMYDSAGNLLYAGGITAGRGHAGDSFGKAAVLSLLREPPAKQPATAIRFPVFGCALFASTDAKGGEIR